jgi:hypothetical protein
VSRRAPTWKIDWSDGVKTTLTIVDLSIMSLEYALPMSLTKLVFSIIHSTIGPLEDTLRRAKSKRNGDDI